MARLRIYGLLACLVLVPYSILNGQSLKVEFQIKGLENKSIITGWYYGNRPYLMDTISLDSNGYGIWTKVTSIEQGMYFIIIPEFRYFSLLMGLNQSFLLKTDTLDILGFMQVPDISETARYRNYQLAARKLQQEYTYFEDLLQKELPDSSRNIRLRMRNISERFEMLKDSFIHLYPNTLTAKVLKLLKNEIPSFTKEEMNPSSFRNKYTNAIRHYLDAIDVSDSRLLRTPYLVQRLDHYFNRLLIQKNDSILPAIDDLMKRANANANYFEYFRQWLINNYSQRRFPGSDQVYVQVADRYYFASGSPPSDSLFLMKLRENIETMRPSLPGNFFKGLKLPDSTGNFIDYASLPEKIIILFFYEPDCEPCRYAVQEIGRIIKKYGEKNILVYAVQMGTDRNKWTKLAQTTGPSWIHVDGSSKAGKSFRDYNLAYLPSIYLIGRDKKIIAGKLGIPETEKLLKEYLSGSGIER